MLYAKKDLYAEEGDRRQQIAFAGQLVPAEFEHLVSPDDATVVGPDVADKKEPSVIPPEAPLAGGTDTEVVEDDAEVEAQEPDAEVSESADISDASADEVEAEEHVEAEPKRRGRGKRS